MKKRLTRTIVFTFLAYFLTYTIDFFITPYITESFGAESYGYFSLAKQFTAYTMVFSSVINSFAARFITVEYKRNDYVKADSYYSTVFFSNVILSLIVLLISSIFIYNLEDYLQISYTMLNGIKLVFLFAFLNFGLVNTAGVFSNAHYVSNRLDLYNINKIAADLFQVICIFALIKIFDDQIYNISIAICFRNLSLLFLLYIQSKGLIPRLSIKKSCFSINSFKTLIVNGSWNAFNSLGNILNSGLDLIVCNMMLGDIMMGYVAVIKSLTTIAIQIVQLVSQPFHPVFLDLYAKSDKAKLMKMLKFSMKLSGYMSSVFYTVMIGLGFSYFKLWLPNQNTELLYKLAIIGCFSIIFEGPVIPLYYIYTLTLKIRFPCFVTIIGGCINVIGMFVLIRYTRIGVYAILLTTAIIMTIISLVTNPIYLAKCMNEKKSFFYNDLLRIIISSLSSSILVFFIKARS